jgi:ATP-dependent Clp protease ATP-binding subunit ClpC
VKTKKRVFAATETLALRAACVFRQEENGNYLASLPHFSIEFYFYDFKMLKQLVTTYVQENLKGLTPLELSRFLPARSVILEEITFNVKRSTERREVTIKTPNLNAIAEPIGQTSGRSKKIKAYERDAEITDLMRRLSEEQANIILLGESGTGKTTVLAAAVRKLQDDLASGKTVFGEETDDDNAETTSRHRFWQTNGSRLIAGMKYLGQWQERCEAVIAELSEIKGVLCAENLLDLISVGGSDPSESLAAFLMPFLERGELRMVIEAAPPELDACRRLLPGFIDSFEIVRLPEFTQEKALSLLEKLAAVQSHNSSIIYSQKIIDLIYRLFSRFLPYETFPGKTPIFLNELFEKQKTKNKKQIVAVKNQAALTIDDVIENFVKLTGLPELFLRDEIPLEISEIINTLASQVIGQPAACRQVANLVTTFKAGLNDPNRPLGVLLFAGQTGVGKTELAKALSRFFFGASEKQNENRLIRLDMSEYSLPGAASRLLINANGSPSELIQKVRQQPFCVVLFDEIEKAEPGVFDILLNLFDEGRLTDRFGRVANFRSAVVILTSNLGAEKLGSIGFGENNSLSFERDARAFFRPEFFNRLDSIVEFSALSHNSINQIAEKELLAIAEREGLQTANIKLIWSPATIDLLVARGFDLRYGARPLQRTIENLVTTPLAKFLLANPNLQNCQLKIDLTAETEIIFSTTDFDS